MQKLELNNVILDIKTILSQNPAPVKRIGVFGSIANGKIHKDSDIDIAIEYDTGEDYGKYNFDSFLKFCEICEILSEGMAEIYKRKIDVVEIEERPGSFLYDIQGEIIWI